MPRQLGALFGSADRRLADLIARARASIRCTERVRALLGEPATSHLTVARVEGTELVLCFDSPVWAARLRFQIPELLERLRHDLLFQRVASVRFALAPAAEPASQVPLIRSRISVATAHYLRGLADSTCDPDLKSIFEKLSRRADK